MLNEKNKNSINKRLNIITGQINGLKKMIEEEKYCVDILTQISAIQASLEGVGKVVVRQHLETCITHGIRGNDAEKHYDELMRIIYKLT